MEDITSSALFEDPQLRAASVAVQSCEHCQTVTWAGVPACGCEFGRRASDQDAVNELLK